MIRNRENCQWFLFTVKRKKLIAGAYRVQPSFDSLFPITVTILNQIVRSVNHTTDNMYDQCLYKAMFLFAFNTFSRIGELASSGNHVIQLKDIEFEGEKQNQAVTVTFTNFKQNLHGSPHKISFHAGPSVIVLTNFLHKHGSQPVLYSVMYQINHCLVPFLIHNSAID